MEKQLPQKTELQALSREQLINTLFQMLDEKGQEISLNADGQIPVYSGDADLIPLKDWALQNGISPATARQKAGRGAFRTAKKIGRDWMISRHEPNVDHRYKDPLPGISGPIHIDEVLNYLLLSDPSMLPEQWKGSYTHQSYFKSIFSRLRNRLTGNERILFQLICDAMEVTDADGVSFVSHEEIYSNLREETWNREDYDNMDFDDYLAVLSNTIFDMMRYPLELSATHGMQMILLPWYKSLTWKKDRNDGIYFIPSDFFRLIFRGIRE